VSRSDIDRLRDARDFARHAQDNAEGLGPIGLLGADRHRHAALYDLVVLGEAFSKVSPEIKAAAPAIPWRSVIALRNIIVHSYCQIDLDMIGDVIDNRIGPLIDQLDELIALIHLQDP